MPMYGGRYGGGMGYGMSPLDFEPQGAQTANVAEMFGAGQQHAQQMQDEQTMEALRQNQLAEQTYEMGQQKASQEVNDALAKGTDSPEWQAAQNKYPSMAKSALQDQQVGQMKLGVMQLGYIGAQAKAFDGDLFNLRSADDYITNRDALQQKYPNVVLPPASEFSGADGDAKLAAWRDDERSKASASFKYAGKTAELTASYIHALGTKDPVQIAAAKKDLDDYSANEHADFQAKAAKAAKAVAGNKPTTATGTDVKSAEDFISGDSYLKNMTDPSDIANVKQQLAQAGHAMVQSGQAPDLDTAFERLKPGIKLSPGFKVLGMSFGGGKLEQGGAPVLQATGGQQKQQYPNDPGPGKRKVGQIYMYQGKPKKWGG